jgi:hypothetical protein|tara:strand:- start:701 stop:1297 length:597 start_codon:yes stop_codon:yes gene_type:complete
MYLSKEKKAAKLSKPSKMPCYSWSLQAGTKCVINCKYCYAKRGNYKYPSVVNAMTNRDNDWRLNNWVERMTIALEGERYFRWFDSGDLYCQELINKIVSVCIATTDTKHLILTKAYLNPKLKLNSLANLDNVVLRYSTVEIDNLNELTKHNATVVTKYIPTIKSTINCPVGVNKDKHTCGNCRACWSKQVKIIYFRKH